MGEPIAAAAKEAPWYAAYPEAKSIAITMTRSDLLDMMKMGKKPGEDYILVDLRRADHEVVPDFKCLNDANADEYL